MKPLLLLTIFCACAAEPADSDDAVCFDGKCDDPAATCSDARYSNGSCDIDLACSIPDIDCFVTFDTDAQASQWFAQFEQLLAQEQSRAPRSILPETDPRFVKIRGLLDRGWDAFRTRRPVGLLRDIRPGLVMVDDPGVNAFVIPDIATDRSALVVIVQTGALTANQSDEAVLGVVMHELQHAVGLHLIRGVKMRMDRYYVAPALGEPIGRLQLDEHAIARAHGQEWRARAAEVGYFSDAALGGYPASGELRRVLQTVLGSASQQNPQGCARTLALQAQLGTDVGHSIDHLSGAIVADPNTLLARTNQVLEAAKFECTAAWTQDLVDVMAAMANQPRVVIEQNAGPDLPLIAGRNVIEGIAALTIDRRAKMRAIEASFTASTGRPWSALRYFSYEEDADDVSVPVMRGAGYAPAALSDFLRTALLPTPALAAQCRALIDGGAVPSYGVDLTDQHHSTCWRSYHIEAVAKLGLRSLNTVPLTDDTTLPTRLPIPESLADRILY